MKETMRIEEITAEKLYNNLNSENRPVLINALGPDAYISKRIPGSINVPSSEPDIIESIVPDQDQPIVVYCANSDCEASPTLARKLMDKGYNHVLDFDEGLAGWRKAGYTLVGKEVQK